MSSTRLLVLGVVRIFQPVHGYLVRRELLSWDVEKWASINPGSIYNALRSLAREGYLEETGTQAEGARPARTTYRLTPDGEQRYLDLLRRALWEVDEWDPTMLLAGLSFMTTLPRAEVVDALDARIDQLAVKIKFSGHAVRELDASRMAPAHTRELFELTAARLDGERRWTEVLRARVAQGHYRFRDEPGWNAGPGPDGRWPGPVADPSS